MNWPIPTYAHIPLIHGEDGTKLSKRHGAVNLIDLRKKGYLAESIINNLILLGWSPKNQDDEIIQLQNIISKLKAGQPLPDRTIGISIDDGYKSIFTTSDRNKSNSVAG